MTVSDRATPTLLVVAFHFPPLASSGTFRLLAFVRHLSRLGWHLEVVTAAEVSHLAHDPALVQRIPNAVGVERAAVVDPVAWLSRKMPGRRRGGANPTADSPSSSRPRGSLWRGVVDSVTGFLQTPDIYAAWIFTGTLRAIRVGRKAPRPAVVLASGPPMSGLVVGALTARYLGAVLVSDFRDPWLGNDGRAMTVPWLNRWNERLERFVVRSSRVCLVNTRAMRDLFLGRHADVAERFVVLENGFDLEDFPTGPGPDAANGSMTILHMGSLYGRRSARPFLSAVAATIAAEPDLADVLRIRFVGPNEDSDALALVQALLGERASIVSFEPGMPHEAALRAMRDASLLLLIGPASAGDQSQIPAKLFEYLASGRPILALCRADGAIAEVLHESRGRKWIAPADDSAAQRSALSEAIAAFRKGDLRQGPSALPQRFERGRQAERLDGILRSVAPSR